MTVVPVTHPAPMLAVPRRGIRARVHYETMVTPVRLVEADPSELGETFLLNEGSPMAFSVRERAGRPWIRLEGMQNETRRGGGFEGGFGRDVFRAFLAMPVKPRDSDVARAMGRSPVLAHLPWGPPGSAPPPYRAVHVDGRERAGADLQRYLDENVALIGDEVWVRCHGPLTALPHGKSTGIYHVEPHGRWYWHVGNPSTRIDRIDELWRFTQRHLWYDRSRFGAPATLDETVPSGLADLMDDDDVLMWAWDMPAALLREVDAMPPRQRATLDSPEAAGALRAIATWSMRGPLGAYGWDEVPSLMADLEALWTAAPGAFEDGSPQGRQLRLHRAYVEEIARPRLAAREASHDPAADATDAESLAGLGM